MREYSKIADWKSGWGSFETHQVFGESFGNPSTRHCIGLVPLEGLLDYLVDPSLVIARLESATEQLVARWNALEVKKSLEWHDQICRFDWAGRGGKPETTIFEVKLSTYGFFVVHEHDPTAVITAADVKVETEH